MGTFFMLGKVVGAVERVLTDITDERTFSGVFALMTSKLVTAIKPPSTVRVITDVRLLTLDTHSARHTVHLPLQSCTLAAIKVIPLNILY